METSSNSPSLPSPGSHAGTRNGALLLSILLHAVLLIALATLGDLWRSPPGDHGTVRITIIPAPAGTDVPVEPEVADLPVEQEPVGEPPVEEITPEAPAVAEAPAPAPAPTEPSEPEDAIETANNAPTPEPTTIQPPEDTPVPNEVVVVTEPAEPPPATVPEPAPPAPVRKELIADSEGERIERRLNRWARNFTDPESLQSETWKIRGNEYTATVERIAPSDNMGIEQALVTISTERDGEMLTTQMRMQRLGFSHYVQFVNEWDPRVQIHDDVIDGRFHSNTEIFVARSNGVQPTFTGRVTSADGINTSNSRQGVRRSEVFLGGLDSHAPRIPLARRHSLFTDADIDAEQIHQFESDTRIIFAEDGSYRWSTIPDTRRRRDSEPPPIESGVGHVTNQPRFFVGGEDVALHVRGTINGKILVYSPTRITIEGSLVYASDPREDAQSDDYLGLVSDATVEIAGPDDVVDTGDLHIHAAIYARSRFRVRNYGKKVDATLYIFGSVTAGSLTATEPRYGTQINFDSRLADTRPPQFPVTNHYEVTTWDRNWSVVED